MPFAQRNRASRRVAGCAILALGMACGTRHDPARDRTLVIALAAEPTLLLPPLIAETPGFVVADQILERLAEPDSTLDTMGDRAFRPRLAESWAWSADSLSIAFRIDPNARWHDGPPVTARDVRFTFALYTDTAVASPAAPLLANIDSVQVRDERVAVFWFHRRHAQQFFDATYHMRIVPEHALGATPRASLRTSAFARAPTGSGPFRFARWIPGQLVELAADTANRGGHVQFDRVIFTIATDPTAALVRALEGEIDVLPSVRATDLARVARSRTLETLHWPSLSNALVMLDLRDPRRRSHPHPVLGDRSVRRALGMAVNRARVASAALGDGALPASGPLPAPLLRGIRSPLPAFDVAAAAALLDSAGWRLANGASHRHRGAIALRFGLLVPSTATAGQRAAVLVQDQLRRVGVGIDIEPIDNAALTARLAAHNFDAALIELDWDPSPLSARQLWGTPTDAAGESANFGGYTNATFDADIESAAEAIDSRVARSAMSRAWQTLAGDAPAIWLYDLQRVAAVRRCVQPSGERADAWWSALSDWSIAADCPVD
ncbi:MAG TPA: peptide ABC transporter substrate-binding protein [Gemmatimonadaceae bacterium]